MKKHTGLADSPFFAPPPLAETKLTAVFPAQPPAELTPTDKAEVPSIPPERGSVVSRYPDTTIEVVRRAVKTFGKEAATHRFTLTEKRAIAQVVHTLNMQGIRTTENEITRIAINYLIDDFNRAGKDSLLGQVLQALNK